MTISIVTAVGVSFTIVTAIVVPLVIWGYKLDSGISSIKDNHLRHIEHNTATTNERLIEIATILRERQ